jgi:hypothetical protein
MKKVTESIKTVLIALRNFIWGIICMASKKSNFYLTREELIREIIASKKKHRESNIPLSPAECFTPKLTEYLQLMVKNYANKGQWRGYSYIEDMKSDALLTLCQNAFKYNEEKYDNPFGYYTQIIKYCFITFLEKEELMRDIKDSLWEAQGMTPSFARQIKNEMMKDIPDQSNKGMKALKKDVEALNLRIDTLGSVISRVSKLSLPDLDIDFEISEVLEIEPKGYTGDLDAVIELFGEAPEYKVEQGIEIAGNLVNCLSVFDSRTKSNTKRIIPNTDSDTVILALCSIGLTVRRDLLVKQIRQLSGYNITSTRMPTADKIVGDPVETEAPSEPDYSTTDYPASNRGKRRPKKAT